MKICFPSSVFPLFPYDKYMRMSASTQHYFTVQHFCASVIVNGDTSEDPEPVAVMKW